MVSFLSEAMAPRFAFDFSGRFKLLFRYSRVAPTVALAALAGAVVIVLTLQNATCLDPMRCLTSLTSNRTIQLLPRISANEMSFSRASLERTEAYHSDMWQRRIRGELFCNEGSPVQSSRNDKYFSTPPGFTLSEDNLEQILACVSNSRRQIIFTTFDIWKDSNGALKDDALHGMTAFNYNWAKHLERVGLRNYLLVGMSEEACGPSREGNLTCYVNNFPFLEGVKVYKGRQVAVKWYLLLRIILLGYNAIFLDNDVAVAKNPFPLWDMRYDLQALSDMKSEDGTVPKLKGTDFPCNLMAVFYAEQGLCLSSGIMFVRSSPATVAFLNDMVMQLEQDGDKGWEQATMRRVVKTKNYSPPFLLRVLPLKNYHNLNMLDARKSHGNHISTVMAHCGYIHGSNEKQSQLENHGFWIRSPGF